MNDYDDDHRDHHEKDADPAYTYSQHDHLQDDLAGQLREAVTPDSSYCGPRRLRHDSASPSPMQSTSLDDLNGTSLADELGGQSDKAAPVPPTSSALSFEEAAFLTNGSVAPSGDSLGDELAALDTVNITLPPPIGEEAEAARAAQEQSKYEETAAFLAESVRTTEEFLERLRHATNADCRANSLGGDDKASLEAIGNSLGLTLRDHARQREAQVRELKEMVRSVSRDDYVHRMILAQALLGVSCPHLEDDGSIDEDHCDMQAHRLGQPFNLDDLAAPGVDLLGFALPRSRVFAGGGQPKGVSQEGPHGPSSSHPTASSSSMPSDSGGLDTLAEETNQESMEQSHEGLGEQALRSPTMALTAASTPSADLGTNLSQPPAGPSRRAPIAAHLEHFRTVTASLVSTLQIMSEHSQMTTAGSREASKRLRVFNKAVSEWQRESQLVQKSQLLIERAEASTASGNSKILLRPSKWVQEQIRQIAEELNQAHLRAEKLLSPISLTV